MHISRNDATTQRKPWFLNVASLRRCVRLVLGFDFTLVTAKIILLARERFKEV
jgi:hypothetical protein